MKTEAQKREKRCCIVCDDREAVENMGAQAFLKHAIYEALKQKKDTFIIPYRAGYETAAAYYIRFITKYRKRFTIALVHPGPSVPSGSEKLLKYADFRSNLSIDDHPFPQDELNRWMVDHSSLLILLASPRSYDLLALAQYAKENSVPVIMNNDPSFLEPLVLEDIDLHDFLAEEEIAEALEDHLENQLEDQLEDHFEDMLEDWLGME